MAAMMPSITAVQGLGAGDSSEGAGKVGIESGLQRHLHHSVYRIKGTNHIPTKGEMYLVQKVILEFPSGTSLLSQQD